MTSKHWVPVFVSLAFLAILYVGCETKSNETIAVEKSRALNFEKINVQTQLENATKALSGQDRTRILFFDQELKNAQDPEVRIDILKKMAGFWYQQKQAILSGVYAERIAELEDSADAWGLSGTTYYLAMQQETEKRKQEYAKEKALLSFDNAVSLDPEDVQHRINRALVSVEMPPEDNPMMGIQQLLELSRNYPDNSSVLIQLASLGLRTGQYDKAIGRLETVLVNEPDNQQAICLLAEAYKGKGENSKAEQYASLCKK